MYRYTYWDWYGGFPNPETLDKPCTYVLRLGLPVVRPPFYDAIANGLLPFNFD